MRKRVQTLRSNPKLIISVMPFKWWQITLKPRDLESRPFKSIFARHAFRFSDRLFILRSFASVARLPIRSGTTSDRACGETCENCEHTVSPCDERFDSVTHAKAWLRTWDMLKELKERHVQAPWSRGSRRFNFSARKPREKPLFYYVISIAGDRENVLVSRLAHTGGS